MEGKKADYLVKVIVIGDSGVGKTNLITRFCQNHFRDTYVATIGVDFKIKSLVVGDKKFKMQIWDTAGQERFKNITQTYYKGAAGILMVYSIIDPTSFSNIERWMQQIDTHAPENVSRVLVATKTDLEGQRSVSKQEGKDLADRYGIPFLEVSAKEGTAVKQSFQTLGRQIVRKYEQDGEAAGLGGDRGQKISRQDSSERQCAC